MSVGSRIKELRKAINLNQQDFASKLSLNYNIISKWECETANTPDNKILLICNTFNVSYEWLKNGTGQMFNNDEYNEIVKAHPDLDDLEKEILHRWCNIDKEKRKIVLDEIRKLFK